MDSRRPFTGGQWAAALGIALSLHVLLGWALLALEPSMTASPAGPGGGFTVNSLSFGGADLPVLVAVSASGEEQRKAADAAPANDILYPVGPLPVRPMRETVPEERKSQRSKDAKPRPKKESSKVAKPLQKTRRSNKALKRPSAGGTGAGKRVDAGAKQGKEGVSAGRDKARGAGGVAGVDRGAAPVPSNPRPQYPRLARSRGEEGRVMIRVSVLGSGRVGSASVVGSSGHGALDRAALKAVKRWRFRPALRAGKPVKATLTVPVVFRLKG